MMFFLINRILLLNMMHDIGVLCIYELFLKIQKKKNYISASKFPQLSQVITGKAPSGQVNSPALHKINLNPPQHNNTSTQEQIIKGE